MKTLLSLAAIVLVGTSTGCTRDISSGGKVRLTIPFTDNASLASADLLRHVIINIQISGKPAILVERDYEEFPIVRGEPFDITIDKVPVGKGVLIQFLGVYETESGGQLIAYGDSIVEIVPIRTDVKITPTPAGLAGKEARVMGRYLTSTASGPTGKVTTYYNPPNGRPRMAVEQTDIVSGWFSIFALEHIPFTHIHTESGLTLFSNLTIGSPTLSSGAPNVLKAEFPAHFERDSRDGVLEVRRRPAQQHIQGYFASAAAVSSILSNKVCFANYSQGIPGWYKAYSSPTLSGPLTFEPYAGDISVARIVSGGFPVSNLGDLYGSTSYCDPSSLTDMAFHQVRTGQGEEEMAGIRPPFRLVRPFERHGGYLERVYDSSSNHFVLKWAYLPNSSPNFDTNSISGVELLYKNSNGGGSGGGGRDDNCERLKSDGYQVLQTLTTSTSTLTIASFGGATIVPGSEYMHHFALCPYKTESSAGATGRRYLGKYIQSDSCTGSCNEGGFGWGVVDLSTTPGSAGSQLGMRFDRVNMVSTSSPLYDTLSLTGGGTYPMMSDDYGAELLVQVAAAGSSSACGTFEGRAIMSGTRTFTRVIASDTNWVKIPKGSFVAGLNNTGLSLSNGASMCAVTVTVIPHFKNLHITANLTGEPFSFTSGGGMLAFRVSGQLTVTSGSTLGVDGLGFARGAANGYSGQGTRGVMASGDTGNAGGTALGVGGGGAGYGRGGSGQDSSGNPGGTGGNPAFGGSGLMSMVMGGGGGNSNSSTDGNGGGVIFVAARNVASGGMSLDASGKGTGNAGGAGGGGSVIFLAEQILPSTFIEPNATGGLSTNSPDRGGAGGGGIVWFGVCNKAATATVDTNPLRVAGGGGGFVGTMNGAENGIVTLSNGSSSGQWNLGCESR